MDDVFALSKTRFYGKQAQRLPVERIAELNKLIEVGEHGLSLKLIESPDRELGQLLVALLWERRTRDQWYLGDAIMELEQLWGEDEAESAVSEVLDISRTSYRQYRAVSEAFPNEEDRRLASWSAYRECTKGFLGSEDRKEIIEKASEADMTAEQIREMVREKNPDDDHRRMWSFEKCRGKIDALWDKMGERCDADTWRQVQDYLLARL